MKTDPYISATSLAEKLGISRRKTETNIGKLRELGLIQRVGPPKGGHWEIINQS
ncbi:winged helix-turn-helix domain-containing protein [Prolixibacter sp. SD074]|uniref:winged helix-turn-helix domain-containing protein n=1 Tax=Prolixibacter sp. SD074 TaxID=2652391 RepID=UPI0035A333D9